MPKGGLRMEGVAVTILHELDVDGSKHKQPDLLLPGRCRMTPATSGAHAAHLGSVEHLVA